MKDKDHKLLEEAWKQVYVEEPNMSPEEAHEAHGKGETLMVTTADGTEFIVDPGVGDSVEADPQNGLVFMGTDPDGGEVEVRADDISMIKSLSDKESIRGFDPNKSHEAQFTGDKEMAQQGKPTADEAVRGVREKTVGQSLKDVKIGATTAKHGMQSLAAQNPQVTANKALDAVAMDAIPDRLLSPVGLPKSDEEHQADLDKIKNEKEEVQEEGENCPPGYYWCTKSKKCKKKSDDEHDDDMRAANAQTAAMAGMPESTNKSLEDITEDHWSQMPAAKTLHNFKKAIADLEPAGDVREWYIDAADAGVDTRVLDKILIVAVKEGDLHRAEAHFIKTGSQDHPDQDPSDVGHRGFDRTEEGCGGASITAVKPELDHEDEDRVKQVLIKRIKRMRPRR